MQVCCKLVISKLLNHGCKGKLSCTFKEDINVSNRFKNFLFIRAPKI